MGHSGLEGAEGYWMDLETKLHAMPLVLCEHGSDSASWAVQAGPPAVKTW